MTTHLANRNRTFLALFLLPWIAGCAGDPVPRRDTSGPVIWPEAGTDGPIAPNDLPLAGQEAKVPTEGGLKPDGPGTKDLGGPAPFCKPYCDKVPSINLEGWYNGCTKVLLKLPGTNEPYYDTCKGCSVDCKFVGQAAEGWYSGCSQQVILVGKCQ
jgi:hypothetical protein